MTLKKLIEVVCHLLQPFRLAIDSAGNIWVANNWNDAEVCNEEQPAEAESTLCGGNGLVVFLGLAKPVATPLLGPPRVP